MDVFDETGPWWPVYMNTISLGGVVMFMGTNMYMDVFLMVIDLLIQICCLCDIMFYAVCVIRIMHSPVILMLCCPLQVITLWVEQSRTTFST